MKKAKAFLHPFTLLNKAYQGLKLLLDPSVEGSPYMHEIEKSASNDTERSFVSLKRISWR